MTRAIVVGALVLCAIGALARVAGATGLCENTPTAYQPPHLFDPATQTFAVSGTFEWCVVGKAGNELRGRVDFTQLWKSDGTIGGMMSSARGDDAKQLTAGIGSFEYIAAGKIGATLAQRGYVPIVQAHDSCFAVAAWGVLGTDEENGFPASRLTVYIAHDGYKLDGAHIDAGLAASARHDNAVIRANFMPARAEVAVWILAPVCDGPPPGHFGSDDPGECYHVDRIKVVTLSAALIPALAVCFKP